MAFLNDPNVKDLHLRDDYQELVELTLLVLGQTPQEIHWRAPGAIDHARWMAKLRGVKLLEEYNQIITRDEEEKQLLVQVVEANRKAIPTETTKKAAVAAVSD